MTVSQQAKGSSSWALFDASQVEHYLLQLLSVLVLRASCHDTVCPFSTLSLHHNLDLMQNDITISSLSMNPDAYNDGSFDAHLDSTIFLSYFQHFLLIHVCLHANDCYLINSL